MSRILLKYISVNWGQLCLLIISFTHTHVHHKPQGDGDVRRTWPIRYRPFPSSKCIFFCFLSNKREERDYLLSLFVLLYVELASFGTPPTPHTHARRHHKPRHSPHHATLGRGAMGSYGVHDTSPPPLLIAPSWEPLAWERRAMRS